MKRMVKFQVNGEQTAIDVEPTKTLLDVLREDLFLTGTKRGCDGGECGACTVLLNGQAVHSCLILAAELEGQDVLTIEGLSKNPKELHPLQKAFIEKGAVQCGFCTPGLMMSAKALLDRNPNPTEEEVRHSISGNLCRCTGYSKIVDAILTAGGEIRGNSQ